MADARGVEVDLIVAGRAVAPAPVVVDLDVSDAIVAGEWGPWLPGFVREAMTERAAQRRLGVHHTPPAVVDEILDLVERAVGPIGPSLTVLDPAVGGGAFLLAAVERFTGDRAEIAGRCWAVDVDAVALATARAALSLWARHQLPDDHFVTGDFLAPSTVGQLPDGFDLIVGNPPFLSQLRGDTSRSADAREALRERWPDVGRYVDDAAAFLLAAADLLGSGGALALVQPNSVLAASDTAPVRARLQTAAPIRGLWVDEQRSFAAGVDTVAVVAVRDRDPGPVLVGDVECPAPSGASWGGLLAAGRGVPLIEVSDGRPTLGTIAHLTAGFRDQFYGLVDAVQDDPDARHPLITVGLIDPLDNAWGRIPAKFARRSFTHPGVVLERVDPKIDGWIRDRMVPKVLVASQTKVLEAIVDEAGVQVPSVPVVSVEPGANAPSLWHVAALLTCPVATVLALLDASGTALSANAIRVSASRLAALPLPVDRDAWDAAADAAQRGDVAACGAAMLDSHGFGDRRDVFDFWRSRLPF